MQVLPKRPQSHESSQTGQDTPRQAQNSSKKLHHSPGQDQTARDRPSTAQHRTKTSPGRLTFQAKNIERPFVVERLSRFQATSNANPKPTQPPDRSREKRQPQTLSRPPKTCPRKPQTGPRQAQNRPKSRQDNPRRA